MIPVHRPRLPLTEKILPYLQRIDGARWYSNFGPLLCEFEGRLAEYFNVAPAMVATAGNGTLMLTSMLKALNVPEDSFCIMPSWTFIATAAAAHYAGLIPYFVDVDITTQALDPLALKDQLALMNDPVGAVIVVAPFGATIDICSWDQFTDETGIPVIIDAAAGFDTVGQSPLMTVGRSPIMVSMHATKVFGIGEGGIGLSTNTELIWKIKSMTGFGLNLQREALLLGTNAKLSEYTAAVGLAAMDEWSATRREWEIARNHYINHCQVFEINHSLSADYVTSTCNVMLPEIGEKVAEHLKAAGVDTRKWWFNGCHQHHAYKHFPRSRDLSATDFLSRSVLGLPFAIDISEGNINYVCEMLSSVLMNVNQYKMPQTA